MLVKPDLHQAENVDEEKFSTNSIVAAEKCGKKYYFHGSTFSRLVKIRLKGRPALQWLRSLNITTNHCSGGQPEGFFTRIPSSILVHGLLAIELQVKCTA